MTSLRIVIQHRETKQFCKHEAAWTKNEQEAREFPNALSAFDFASERNLGDVEILFRTKRYYLLSAPPSARPVVRAF